MPDTFQEGTDWQQSSEPHVMRQCALGNLWPQGARSGSGIKDTLAVTDSPAKHPVLAIGGRTVNTPGDRGRPENITGVVVSYSDSVHLVTLNLGEKYIVKQYVFNVLTYAQGAAATFETAPIIGQPVYVDDSDDLSEGVTLSLSPLNDGDLPNPLAGWLWYCQDEYYDYEVGGPNAAAQWPKDWADDPGDEYEVCVMLTNGTGQACCDVPAV